MKPPNLSLVVLLSSLFHLPFLSSRRNSKYARNWSSLDKVKTRSSIKRHISSGIKLKNSPIHYISLPANPYSYVPGLGYISPAAKPSSHLFSDSQDCQDNTGKVKDGKKKEAVKKQTNFNLAEFPKTGNGVRLKDAKRKKKPHNFSLADIRYMKRKLQKKKESVIRPKVPFVLNGKPFNLHAMKKQKMRTKVKSKKGNSSKILKLITSDNMNFNSNGKPHKVYELKRNQDKTKISISNVSSKNSNTKLQNQPIQSATIPKDSAMSESVTSVKTNQPRFPAKPSPTNSPIYTYKLPQVFSVNSLRSLLGKTKDNQSGKINEKLLDILIGSTTLPTTTSTTTSTTTTTTTLKTTKTKRRKATNSPIYYHKMPSMFSMNLLKSFLGKPKDNKSDQVNTNIFNMLVGTTISLPTTTTTAKPTTTTTTKTTTTTIKIAKVVTVKPTNSPIYTYKLPQFFSMNSLRSLLSKPKDSQSEPFSLKKFFNVVTGASVVSSTTTTTTTSTTTTSKTTVTKKSPSSPLTWLSGQFNGIPTKIFHFKAPFSVLSWMKGLQSSLYPSEDIIRG